MNSPAAMTIEQAGAARSGGRLAAAALGALSLTLYALLFWFDEELLALAQSTRSGDKRFFFVPIAIALLFSFVHGAFTGRFWDVLGLRAKR